MRNSQAGVFITARQGDLATSNFPADIPLEGPGLVYKPVYVYKYHSHDLLSMDVFFWTSKGTFGRLEFLRMYLMSPIILDAEKCSAACVQGSP